MKFYINDVQVQIEKMPQLSVAIDTTNDSFECVLKVNNRETPYEPMSKFKIEFDDGTTKIMWIISDNVSIFSMNPRTFKHSLSIVQYRYFLNKHLVRNSVFTQPRTKNARIYGAVSACLFTTGSGSSFAVNYRAIPKNSNLDPDYWTDTLVVNPHTKLKSFKYKVLLYGATNRHLGTSTLTKITTLSSDVPDNAKVRTTARFQLIDTSNSNHFITSIYIREHTYADEFKLDEETKNIINTYLESRGTNVVTLALQYNSGYTNPSSPKIAGSFVTTTQTSVTDDFDPEDDTSYTYLTAQLFIEMEVFNYTMYDIIEQLQEQHRLYDMADADYKRPALFQMPSSDTELYKLLKSTYAPDTMAFTQSSFYEALEQIFKFYDAGFRFDSNGELEIEYYNQTEDQVNPKISGMSLTHSSKNFNNGRITYYQNAITKISLNRVKVRADSLGVPAKSDYGLILPKPIYDITKLELTVNGSVTLYSPELDNGTISTNAVNLNLDLTHFVVNEDIWLTLDKQATPTDALPTDMLQITTLPFKRGSTFFNTSDYYSNFLNQSKTKLSNIKKVATLRFFGIGSYYDTRWTAFHDPDDDDWVAQNYNIEYEATNDGRVRTETLDNQYLGEILTNQSDGLVDLGKLGLAMYSESLRDGMPTLTISCEINAWDKRIVEGDYILYNGDKWIATLINYTILNSTTQKCDVTFTKNFNMTSLRIRNDNEKRLTNISQSLATMSEENFVEFVYLTTDETKISRHQNIKVEESFIGSILNKTFSLNNSDFSALGDIDFGGFSKSPSSKKLYIPVIKYGAGNCLCFEFQFDDPISAGNQLVVSSGWFGTNKYFSQVAKYTDDEGWADYIYLNFYKMNDSSATIDDTSNEIIFPEIDTTKVSTIGTLQLKYLKKPNEIFGINYELCFLPMPEENKELFISLKFIQENGIFTNPPLNKKFYLYYDSETEYSILDIKTLTTNKIEASIQVQDIIENGHEYIKMTIAPVNEINRIGKWALGDEYGNIYFSSNKEPQNSFIILYFVTRKNRI